MKEILDETIDETKNPEPALRTELRIPTGEPVILENRWGSLPVTKKYSGPIQGAFRLLPEFDRVTPERCLLGRNDHFDLVVRKPQNSADRPVPVGMVSKNYRVIPHREVLRAALDFVRHIPHSRPTTITLHATPNWERILFGIMVGSAYSVSPDGYAVGLRLVCRNSVDGSSAVRASLGWFRAICCNGMVTGVTLAKTRVTHQPNADVKAVFDPLKATFSQLEREQNTFARWTSTALCQSDLRPWVDGPVAKRWNSLAAARVWHIVRSGRDARFVPPFEKKAPSERAVELLGPVPGSPDRAETVYDLAQALSYVASHRSDVAEVEGFQRAIGPLLRCLPKN